MLPSPSEAAPAGARRILVLANRLPFPLDDGWKVRTFHLIRGLMRLGEVTLLVYHPPEEGAVLESARAAFGRGLTLDTVAPPRAYSPGRLFLGLVTDTPVHVWNQESGAYAERVRRLVEAGFDVVVAETTFMGRYLRLLPAGTLRVIDTHNVDSVTMRRYAATMTGLRRWYAARTVSRLEAHERRMYRAADMTWVCSETERRLVGEMTPGAAVTVVPNGVDTETVRPLPEVEPVPGRLLFFGRLDYFPNLDALRWFAAEILPRLRGAHPRLELVVVGQGAGPELTELAGRNPEIKLVGRVEDVPPVLAAAAVVVVPLRAGGGTRLKILEALSAARPTVSTTIGAEGLELDSGRDLLIADTAEAFADAVRSLLGDPAEAEALGRRGRETVRRQYDWRAAADTALASLRDKLSSR